MKFILDTHTFIWWDSNPSELSQQVLGYCNDKSNTLILSVVSVWEMQIKTQLGKLKLNLPLADLIMTQQDTNISQVLPVNLEHVLALENLPIHHKDPFDRLLIAQSIIEDAILLSRDKIFSEYPVSVTW